MNKLNGKLSFSCAMYEGSPVTSLDGSPLQNKESLQKGKRVSVPTLMGRCEAIVEEVDYEKNTATAISGGLIAWLNFGKDDRNCWTSAASGNKDALVRIQLV